MKYIEIETKKDNNLRFFFNTFPSEDTANTEGWWATLGGMVRLNDKVGWFVTVGGSRENASSLAVLEGILKLEGAKETLGSESSAGKLLVDDTVDDASSSCVVEDKSEEDTVVVAPFEVCKVKFGLSKVVKSLTDWEASVLG